MIFILHLNKKRLGRKEDGQVIILFVAMFVLLMGAAVVSIDIGTYVQARQRLEITVDAAVLAGGLELPTSGTKAVSKALEYININDSEVDFDNVETSFRCLVGDRNHDGSPDSEDIPVVCNPGAYASFTCENGLCISSCEFTGGNTCNVMAVTASKDVPLIFTRLLGLPPVLITASRTGACKGPCGDAPNVALDVIIVLDRSGSMSGSDLANAKDGALAVLELFNPELQHVGLAVLGAGRANNACVDRDPNRGGNWLVVPLSDDYKNSNGTLNTNSELVMTINCLNTSSQGTNLGSPLSDQRFSRPDALDELLNSGRNVKKGIIFMTDGAANEPTSDSCEYANDMATIVKDQDIEIFTIGYGIEAERCGDRRYHPYYNARVTELLADMATDSLDDFGHCSDQNAIDSENTDGDHFLCQPRGGDLEQVFRVAATALSTGIRLIQYPGE